MTSDFTISVGVTPGVDVEAEVIAILYGADVVLEAAEPDSMNSFEGLEGCSYSRPWMLRLSMRSYMTTLEVDGVELVLGAVGGLPSCAAEVPRPWSRGPRPQPRLSAGKRRRVLPGPGRYRSECRSSERIRAMPMMPMLPAKGREDGAGLLGHEVVEREGERGEKAHRRGAFCSYPPRVGTESGSKGSVSPWIWPSSSRTMRVEYLSARSGLCVTMMTSLSLEISLRSSMICTLVSESARAGGII